MVFITLLAGTAHAGNVKGVVRDCGKPKPNGIDGVKVHLISTSSTGRARKISVGPTDAQGNYEKTMVDDGTYELVAEATGYSRVGTNPSVKVVSGDNNMPDIELMLANADQNTYQKIGQQLGAQIRTKSDKQKSYDALSGVWREDGLPPAAKLFVIQGITLSDEGAKTAYKPFEDYLGSTEDGIKQAQAAIQEIVLNGKDLPQLTQFTEGMKVKGDVLADITAYQLRKTGSALDQGVFLEKLSSADDWRNVAKPVNQWYKERKNRKERQERQDERDK